MKQSDIESRLKDIVSAAEITIKNLEYKKKWFVAVEKQVGQLDELLCEHVEDLFDMEELLRLVRDEIFTHELDDCLYMSENLWDAIETYADSLSESKQEVMMDKYEDLGVVINKFNQSIADYDTFENVIEHIEEAIDIIQEMY